jgi:O-glycosyl hydrolase
LKITVLFFSLFCLCLIVCGQKGGSATKPARFPSNVPAIKIWLNQEQQTMDGFGASDAWRCQMIGKYWPIEKRNAIADLLFSKEVDRNGNPKGIGLSIWRFNIGAGSYEQGDSSNIADEWRRAECFQRPDGTYDWTKQEGQRWFLQAAKQRGVENFLAFTISAPVHMTINNKAFSPQKVNMNIKRGKLPDYAEFLVETIDNLQKREGVKFNYISPINEPQWDWMAKGGGKASQEGTPATNGEVFEFIKSLSGKLRGRSLNTKIVFGEAGAINYLYQDVNEDQRDEQVKFFFGKSSPTNIAGLSNVANIISGHSYFSVWPVAEQILHRKRLAECVQQTDSKLKYWQTEYCILEQPGKAEIPGGNGRHRDLGIKTALFVARIIHNDITIANASSWQWWTALTRHDFKDGLIYLDDGKSNGVSGYDGAYCKMDGYYRPSKLLWALGNYSRFIRPGMVRINVSNTDAFNNGSGLMISAFKDNENKKLVIVAVNCTDSLAKFRLDMQGVKLHRNKLTPYITAENRDLELAPDVDCRKIEIPARSVVTFTGMW